MRGYSYLVSMLLVVAIGITLAVSYYFYTTSYYGTLSAQVEKIMEHYSDLAAKYLQISSAIGWLEGSIARFTVRMYNYGDEAVGVYGDVRWYLRKGGIPIASGYSVCPPSILPGESCTITFTVSSPELKAPQDFHDLEVMVYLDEVPLSSIIQYSGEYPGAIAYLDCNTCSECSSLISSASPGSFVVIHVDSASGDCLNIVGARDVVVYCGTDLVGSGSGVGIRIVGSNGVSIRNCNIYNFGTGIYVENSKNLYFESVYSHDNANYDFYVPPDSIDGICSFSKVDVTATSGPILFFNGVPSYASSILTAAAIWACDSNSIQLSGYPTALSKVSPAIIGIRTRGLQLSDFSASSVEIGIYLRDDSLTSIQGLSVSSTSHAILSYGSASGYICCSTFSSPLSDLFYFPLGIEWDADTVFR